MTKTNWEDKKASCECRASLAGRRCASPIIHLDRRDLGVPESASAYALSDTSRNNMERRVGRMRGGPRNLKSKAHASLASCFSDYLHTFPFEC